MADRYRSSHADHPRWLAESNRARRDVLSNHRPGAHHRPTANADAREHNHASPKPGIIFDDNWALGGKRLSTYGLPRSEPVVVTVQGTEGCNLDSGSNLDSGLIAGDLAFRLNVRIRSNPDASAGTNFHRSE